MAARSSSKPAARRETALDVLRRDWADEVASLKQRHAKEIENWKIRVGTACHEAEQIRLRNVDLLKEIDEVKSALSGAITAHQNAQQALALATEQRDVLERQLTLTGKDLGAAGANITALENDNRQLRIDIGAAHIKMREEAYRADKTERALALANEQLRRARATIVTMAHRLALLEDDDASRDISDIVDAA